MSIIYKKLIKAHSLNLNLKKKEELNGTILRDWIRGWMKLIKVIILRSCLNFLLQKF